MLSNLAATDQAGRGRDGYLYRCLERPGEGTAAATALADQGVDVISQHVDTPAPQIVAQQRGIHGTGHHRDMRQFAPKANVCSSVSTWDKFLIPELKKIKEGN